MLLLLLYEGRICFLLVVVVVAKLIIRLPARAVDQHSFFADPDPAFLFNADPDPAAFSIRIWIQIRKKNFLPYAEFAVG